MSDKDSEQCSSKSSASVPAFSFLPRIPALTFLHRRPVIWTYKLKYTLSPHTAFSHGVLSQYQKP